MFVVVTITIQCKLVVKSVKVIGGYRGVLTFLVCIKVLLGTNQTLFTELKNIFSFSRYSIFKYRKYKGLYRDLKL